MRVWSVYAKRSKINIVSRMIKLPTIYKRTSTGKVQEWTIEIDNDKYRTISGQVGGKSVESEWTTAKGKNLGKKNETSAADQALKEATAKRTLKLEKEYKEDATDVDQLTFPSPLLAKEYTEHKDKAIFPYWSQPKLDGVRCIINAQGMWSRNGKLIVSAPHIRASLGPIFERHPNLELDGELYNHKLKHNFDKIISLVRKTKPTAEELAESAEIVEYWIYDIRDGEKDFDERYDFMREELFIKGSPVFDYCKLVQTIECTNQDGADALYAEYQADGFEGQMIRLKGAKYEFKRSANLLKRKEFMDDDFLILDITEGEGNRSGMAGYMSFETKEGKPFKANMRGGEEYYKELLVNKALRINKKKATVRFQNYTPDGIPRFPVVVAERDYE